MPNNKNIETNHPHPDSILKKTSCTMSFAKNKEIIQKLYLVDKFKIIREKDSEEDVYTISYNLDQESWLRQLNSDMERFFLMCKENKNSYFIKNDMKIYKGNLINSTSMNFEMLKNDLMDSLRDNKK